MSGDPTICSYCQAPIAEGDGRQECPSCHAAYHAECWQENGGCAIYGCAQAPAAAPRSALEVPVSWWGREEKACPVCGQQIVAAAVRCRHCGATFASARPEDAAEFQRRSLQRDEAPRLRRKVVWQFILSLVPFTAPIGAVLGLVSYWPNRRAVAALPSLFPALGALGLIAGLFQTGAFVVFAAWYVVAHR